MAGPTSLTYRRQLRLLVGNLCLQLGKLHCAAFGQGIKACDAPLEVPHVLLHRCALGDKLVPAHLHQR